jgi:transposase
LVDAGYDTAANREKAKDWLGIDYVGSPRATGKGFTPQPCRWVVERTHAWLGKYRRLSKDYEATPETSEAIIYAVMVHLMTRRLARS